MFDAIVSYLDRYAWTLLRLRRTEKTLSIMWVCLWLKLSKLTMLDHNSTSLHQKKEEKKKSRVQLNTQKE